jgi:hypothetical protein
VGWGVAPAPCALGPVKASEGWACPSTGSGRTVMGMCDQIRCRIRSALVNPIDLVDLIDPTTIPTAISSKAAPRGASSIPNPRSG